jgi:N6-L-threonylcarbamoyladenine synthase
VKRMASPQTETAPSDNVALLPKSTKYIIPVNHLEAHLLVPRMVFGRAALPFPFLVLLVSGGHTMLVLTRLDEKGGIMYERLATTLDDSLGECFDKVARIVRVWKHAAPPTSSPPENAQDISPANLASISTLAAAKSGAAPDIAFRKFAGAGASGAGGADDDEPPFSGHLGAMLEQLAAEGDPTAIRFPVPLRGSNSVNNISCCFSFSGLKSAIHRYVSQPRVDVTDRQTVANIASAFHLAALSHLGDQVTRAFSYCGLQTQLGRLPPVNKLVICGGVAANTYVREAMSELSVNFGAETLFPPIRLCTDNGVMIAWAGMEKVLMAQAAHARHVQAATTGEALGFDEFARTQGILALSSPHFKEDLAKLDIAPRWRFL